jgi:hypothetical protein
MLGVHIGVHQFLTKADQAFDWRHLNSRQERIVAEESVN